MAKALADELVDDSEETSSQELNLLEVENRELRDRIKAVEAALKVAGKVLLPYVQRSMR